MKINASTTSQSRNVWRIGQRLFSLTLAIGLCCAGQLASAAVRLNAPADMPGVPGYAQVGFDAIAGDWFILHDYELSARGTLAEDAATTFSVHFMTGGRFEQSGKAYPNLVQAEVRFGE